MRKILKISIFAIICVCFSFLISCDKEVKFDVNFIVDGEIYKTVGTSGNEVIAIPADPIKEGYLFDGWYWDENIWLKSFSANSLLNVELRENMNVYARFIDEDDPVGTELKFKDGTYIDSESIKDTYLIKVSNNTIVFSFSDYVEVGNKATWTVSTDVYGNNIINSKTVELEVGTNLFFIQVTDSETNKIKQYNIGVRRRPIYDVVFDSNGGTTCSIQKVEEDGYATEPSTTRVGYDFLGWDFNFDNPVTSDMYIEASWEAKKYNITFDPNGGRVSETEQTVSYDSSYKLPIPVREGYTFISWVDSNNNSVYDGKWTKLTNLELTAKWKANTYDISYQLNGGNVSGNKPVKYTVGDNISIANPYKTGYEFTGWTVNDETTKEKDYVIDSTMYGDLTLVANYKANEYMVTLDSNGGNCESEVLKVTYDKNYTLPTPTKLGYTFEGWYNGSTKVSSGTWNRTSSLDLKARWSITNYKISYQLDGGSNNSNNVSSYNVDSEMITIFEPSKKGYTFVGWTTEEIIIPTKQISIQAGSTGDKLFVAHFEANEYLIIYDVNSGNELAEDKVTIVYGEEYKLSIPTRDGYVFKGWYNGQNIVNDGVWSVDYNVTLKAKWEIETYNVTYVLNGGVNNNANPLTYNYEYKDIEIINPIKTGYTFAGWKVNNTGGLFEHYVISSHSVGDITLEAIFTANKYNLSLDVNGGNELPNAETIISYDEKFNLPNPTRVGYEFNGWYNGTTKVQSGTWKYLKDLNLVAKWSLINYTITYNLDGGKNNSYNPSKYNYEYEDIVINEPTKTGYTFVGWTYEGIYAPVEEYVIKHNSTGNIELTANFQVNTYYITYDVNGGNDITEYIIGIQYGSKYELIIPNRVGYTFKGWYNENIKMTNGTWTLLNDITLVAKWEIINYSITYNLNGGYSYENPATYTYEDETIILQDPIKKGHTFIGWITDEMFIPTKELEIPNNSQGNLSFEAVFDANEYKITLDVNGGNPLGYTEIVVAYGEMLDLPTPEKPGLTFIGWSNGKEMIDSGIMLIDEDQTLVAKYLNLVVENGVTYITIGKYPQTKVNDKLLISNLSTITQINESGYLVYLDNEYYKYDNNYYLVEDVRWVVLSNQSGEYTLITENIIAARKFGNNDFANSSMKTWLNGEFYDQIFSFLDKEIIKDSFVEGQVLEGPVPYGGEQYESSVAKVFLPTRADLDSKTYKSYATDLAEALINDSYYNGWYYLNAPKINTAGIGSIGINKSNWDYYSSLQNMGYSLDVVFGVRPMINISIF